MVRFGIFSYDKENLEHPGWLTCGGDDGEKIDPLQFADNDTYETFVLGMMGMMVLAEEANYNTPSGIRVFTRCDVSVYRDCERQEYRYFVSEITRSWSTCLFYPWADPEGMGDIMVTQLAKLLHHLTSTKYLQASPPR